ncbi:hypothetical protein DSM106972_025620 [Dulcicalothrix desertica PCC 7102]|uniref:Uncharacterized protein n=1 Tax=Dulcicalothrix desertica PCC 7102 TaxID=232991 RepID=A0A433VMK0_9CYAN|nr:hypothetical protein [Dulcicalothrix desertica]RUT07301.1 hypothetical protein DSM106972_025620 [Dulcicalothrix desertica PCC 7102]TWH55502.1 hypothetical protein CAL7102_03646 [Dulcicalothrix desertica PCC 7102]
MTTYIMNDLELFALKRSHYLGANVAQLRILAKLYNIQPAGSPNYKINWVDNLVAFMPRPAKIWNLGFASNESKHCLADVLDGADLFCAVNTFNHPSIIEKAIIGRCIELGAELKYSDWWLTEEDSDSKLITIYNALHPDDKNYLDKIWSIYVIKKLATETHFLLAKYWHVGLPNNSIQ